jgi:hypothetical protein
MEEWLQFKGINLLPTAADHKLGLVEVQGKIIKDSCRAVVCGIKERFGYDFPKMYFPTLTGDVCSIINRSRRGAAEYSGYEMMFGKELGDVLDVRRDLRVSIGEIVLCHKPRELNSPIGRAKAEWGVVVSRRFDKTGVFEVHLLETDVRVHRFKFVRSIMIPEYVMELARKLDKEQWMMPQAPNPNEIVSSPSTTRIEEGEDMADEGGDPSDDAEVERDEEDRYCPMDDAEAYYQPDEDAEANANGLTTIEGIMERVSSTQISYSKGLLQSGIRAEQAMRVEVQGFLDKMLFHPVHYHEIPDECKGLILESLTA